MMTWGGWDVRVTAAAAWVNMAPRFAAENSIVVDQLERILADPVGAVRLQAAQNLAVLAAAAPLRMWSMANHLASQEDNGEVLAALLGSMLQLSHSAPDQCEAVLALIIDRLEKGEYGQSFAHSELLEIIGIWTAQLYVRQGRPLLRTWLLEWVKKPQQYQTVVNAFCSSLRVDFFGRYGTSVTPEANATCARAQEGMALIVSEATRLSAAAYAVINSNVAESEKQTAIAQCQAAEGLILHALHQLYFGSGAYQGQTDGGPGVCNNDAKARFLADYNSILVHLAGARFPETLHQLIELYGFLVPGNPAVVFDALHMILLGRGKQEAYHYESLAVDEVVSIVLRYIADHRVIFDDDGRHAQLVAILDLFAEAGWPQALRLLFDLPDLLR